MTEALNIIILNPLYGTVAHRGHAANRNIAVTSFKLQKINYIIIAVIKVILLQVIYKVAASYI